MHNPCPCVAVVSPVQCCCINVCGFSAADQQMQPAACVGSCFDELCTCPALLMSWSTLCPVICLSSLGGRRGYRCFSCRLELKSICIVAHVGCACSAELVDLSDMCCMNYSSYYMHCTTGAVWALLAKPNVSCDCWDNPPCHATICSWVQLSVVQLLLPYLNLAMLAVP